MSGPATLAAFQKTRKLSQRGLAELLGLSEGYVSLLLSGQRHAGLSTAFRIAKRTGGQVPAEAWLGRRKRRAA